MDYDYFEYGDGDVLAREPKDDVRFELWSGGKWIPCNDQAKFVRTAVRLDEAGIADWKKSHPDAFAETQSSGVAERIKAAMLASK